MEWNDKLQRVIDYVETHLQREQNPIDKQEIAKIAGCSFDFFQKVFSYMNGFSFSEYVRYRKLTLAGYELKSTNKKVVDVSFEFGYDSPTSFTKAFQQFHGVTPKEARAGEVKLRVVPQLQVSVKGQYSWKLSQKPAFRLVGKSIWISNKDGETYSKIPYFWNECQKNGDFSKMVSMDTGILKGLFGLYPGDEKRTGEIEYSIMVNAEEGLPEGFREIIIPEATWAVFDCIGPVPQAIQNGWDYLKKEWLVKYPFQHDKCPELEWYSDGNAYDKDYLSQIWIPVIPLEQ